METSVNFFFRKLLVIKIFFKKYVITFCGSLYKHIPKAFYFTCHHFRYFAVYKNFSIFAVLNNSCISFNTIYKTDKFSIIITHRNLERCYCLAKFLSHLTECSVEIGIFVIHHIYKHHSWELHIFTVIPCFFCSYFRTGFSRNNNKSRIGCQKSRFNFSRKIKVTRCIYKINLSIKPFNRHYRCLY